MLPQWLIEKKRDGNELTADELRAFIAGYTDGSIPDYQMAALAMAIFFRGLTDAETLALTDAMLHSGDVITFDNWPRPTADKHSTGGIGDKLSLVLAPLAASAGLAVPMISGRSLGLTGGTLDKLESIPGFDTRLSIDRFRQTVADVGCCIIGQTDRLAPADRKLYALRDVTATVPSIPLITASILSKKLAEGAAALVFDVKCGRGAFMRTPDQARQLAQSLTQVGRAMGRRMAALITDMNEPLGRAVGNAVEVTEAVALLHGEGPADARDLTIELTAWMCVLGGVFTDLEAARPALAARLADGRALDVFRRMLVAQGGEPRVADKPEDHLPRPGIRADVAAPRDGWVRRVDAEAIGRVVLQLGAGRRRTEDVIDPAAGIDRLVASGAQVRRGQPLMRLCGRDRSMVAPQLASAAAAVEIGDEPPLPRRLVLETLT
jgi:pyrimidine-nucleoside phosphorylase/thymidine phosphorylase